MKWKRFLETVYFYTRCAVVVENRAILDLNLEFSVGLADLGHLFELLRVIIWDSSYTSDL